jgi:hypothetical protein
MEEFSERLSAAVKRPEAAVEVMRLYGQYAAVYGEVPQDIEHILLDIAAMEDDKLSAREYVRARGVMEEFVQGRQRIKRGEQVREAVFPADAGAGAADRVPEAFGRAACRKRRRHRRERTMSSINF